MKSPTQIAEVVAPPSAADGPTQFNDCFRAFDDQFDYVCRALRRHGVHRDDAEDVAQDVLIVTWRRWSAYDPGRPLRPWLAGIAARVAHDYLKRGQRRELPSNKIELEDPALVGEDRLESARARGQVMAVLALLPERHRVAIVLHDLDGLPPQEIAAVMGVPLPTAYTRIRRARLAFARALTQLKKQQSRVASRRTAPPSRADLALRFALLLMALLGLWRQSPGWRPLASRASTAAAAPAPTGW